ncbi:MerR family transcriptional regulator [Candidatus Enterococcus ferrettii]|uniref:HTH merR-type domain-containing protein n=1 Tax=Candidatus Enterococcus ferrettii TaxID=2815324 RepID=A0ABV0EUA5_9ENTE|nr:MerR family transcriptional regulator [Enterococcus sp. 665A]MBO1339478.1 MerR family transcriptional regulator [Enterococcus sp. 665A]
MFKMTEFSQLTNLTIRTLHYYDEVGLLVPSRESSGHRVYTYRDLVLAHEIILLKETGLSLEEIIDQIKQNPNEPLKESLLRQEQLLLTQVKRIKDRLARIDQILSDEKDLEERAIKNIFIDNNPLKAELSNIWTLDFENIQDLSYLKEFNGSLNFDVHFRKLAKLQQLSACDNHVQQELAKFVTMLTENYGASFQKEGLEKFVLFYRDSPQSQEYFKQYGKDFSLFLSKALTAYIKNRTD